MPASNKRYTRPKRTIVLVNPLDDSLSHREKERAIRRRLVATTGRCPCGAVLALPHLAPGTFTLVAVEHQPGCPAADEAND